MSICRCGKTLPEVSARHRYCAHCGVAHFASCLNPECGENAYFQQSPCCPSCGSLYRYQDSGAPVRQPSAEPMGAPLYDLSPASGDPASATALYAKLNSENSSPEPEREYISPFVGDVAFLDAQARHNRLYILNSAGKVDVLDAFTLQPVRKFRDIALPNVSKMGLAEGEVASLQVGTYALLLRYQSMVYGYHAGNGEPLFQLSGEDFQKFSVTLSQEWLLLVGATNREQRACLYSLSDLCQRRRKPFMEESLASYTPNQNTPQNRSVLPHYTGFYLFAQNGSLYHIEGRGGGKVRSLPIPPQTHIQAWNVSADYGAVLFHPDSSVRNMDGDFQLLTFSIGSFERHREIPLRWSPNRQMRSLIIEDSHFYALDKDMNLLWLSKDAPDDTRRRDTLLIGAEEKNMEIMSIPYGAQPYIVFHSVGMTKHYFAWGRPPLKAMQYMHGVHPGFKKKIRLLYSANRLLLVNMTSGAIQTKMLPAL